VCSSCHTAHSDPESDGSTAGDAREGNSASKNEIVAQILADLQHSGLKKIGFVNNGFF
jgi:hypothetical protein